MGNKVLVFTGGGSGGHVMPALTIIKQVNRNNDYDVHYVGGITSIERELVKDYKLTYHPIHTGKLRRYISGENLKDVLRIFLGLIDAFKVLWKFNKKETLVFSTGGFVCVPVVIAAKLQRKKVFIHEQTSRVGLANKICSFFADRVFISFEDSFKYFDENKTYLSGYPLRQECYSDGIGKIVVNGRVLNDSKKPLMFVTGGGNGAQLINKLIEKNFTKLTETYLIVHQTGKAFIDEYRKLNHPDYIPLPFVGPEMIDLFKLATVTISRSGAGTVCELIAVGKKSIYVPLKIAQKNEQFFNALEAHKKLGSIIIEEKELTDESFLAALKEIGQENPMNKIQKQNGLQFLVEEIEKAY
ncbi:MAG: UDP-N-acetylglucosamine--N-acetylmuramyl-(pentapeptide) pyrophosphoryl-undecaprenol N-acetylglucosamine transferase [Bdellovibrionales bacterium]|nr:UDP-N-acetylglucosamine--N-acetylmuramyl-(pentapeptide) pyrophosphoryl-undecaprenol N-acetylglucosamine transferase [Bdellovibrionales bacterium]